RLGAERAEHGGGEQRRRRSLPRNVAEDEAELTAGQIDVIEEVASDGAARDRRGRGREELPVAIAGGQERLLNRRGDLELLLELCLVGRLAIQARVLERERRFGRQRVERRLRRRGSQGAPLAAVEIQDADEFLGALLFGTLDVADQPERRAEHVADAERDGPGVQLREIA